MLERVQAQIEQAIQEGARHIGRPKDLAGGTDGGYYIAVQIVSDAAATAAWRICASSTPGDDTVRCG